LSGYLFLQNKLDLCGMKIYQIDAFTNHLFGGNPAAIVPLDAWLPEIVMQKLAAENNIAETAFVIPEGENYHIRWFTPTIEVDLCGHATLAAAYVYYNYLGYDKKEIIFNSRSGPLSVRKEAERFVLNFPADTLKAMPELKSEISKILNINILEVYRGKANFMVVVANETLVRNYVPDAKAILSLNAHGLILTAKGDEVDFVSRCFFPEEDPVTGSAHMSLTPYWAEKLLKNRLTAWQVSARKGELFCQYLGKRVEIAGNVVTYMIGEFSVA
jgi:PhzF family phenazine biosynthesis protein